MECLRDVGRGIVPIMGVGTGAGTELDSVVPASLAASQPPSCNTGSFVPQPFAGPKGITCTDADRVQISMEASRRRAAAVSGVTGE